MILKDSQVAKMSPKTKEDRLQRYSEADLCARDESRTHTSQLTLAPETSASTISPPAPEWTANIQLFSKTTKKTYLQVAVYRHPVPLIV